MTHDYSMLFGLMRKRGYTQKKLAIELNKNAATINQKLNGKGSFTQNEMEQIATCLKILPDDIGIYFFNK